jgi:signal peptidase I
LPILFDNIQDNDSNQTRFFIISKVENLKKTDRDKTSLAIKLKNDDKPGALLSLLQEFESRGINLLKIESRPQKDTNEFVFLPFISKKSVEYFKDYQKGDLLTFNLFQKYKNLRNIYNKRLYKITDMYNSTIPVSIKDRYKYIIKLSSHVARNTFVYILLKENVDIFSISNALAHSEIKTTQNYIRSGIDIEASDNAGLVIQSVI